MCCDKREAQWLTESILRLGWYWLKWSRVLFQFFSRLFNWINLFLLLSFSFLSIVTCIFALNEDFTAFACSVFTLCVYSGTSTVTYLIFVTVIKYINNIINHYVETRRVWGKIFHVTHGCCFYLFCCIILFPVILFLLTVSSFLHRIKRQNAWCKKKVMTKISKCNLLK